MSHEGILVLGGRSVDPGYNGRLFFGLQNLSGKAFPLRPGAKLIGATFYRLGEGEIVSDASKPDPLHDFPENLRDFVTRFPPANTQQLAGEVKILGDKVQGVEKLTKDVEELTKDVEELTITVKSVDNKVDNLVYDFKKVSKTYTFLKWLGITAAVAAVGFLVHWILSHLV